MALLDNHADGRVVFGSRVDALVPKQHPDDVCVPSLRSKPDGSILSQPRISSRIHSGLQQSHNNIHSSFTTRQPKALDARLKVAPQKRVHHTQLPRFTRQRKRCAKGHVMLVV